MREALPVIKGHSTDCKQVFIFIIITELTPLIDMVSSHL